MGVFKECLRTNKYQSCAISCSKASPSGGIVWAASCRRSGFNHPADPGVPRQQCPTPRWVGVDRVERRRVAVTRGTRKIPQFFSLQKQLYSCVTAVPRYCTWYFGLYFLFYHSGHTIHMPKRASLTNHTRFDLKMTKLYIRRTCRKAQCRPVLALVLKYQYLFLFF